MSDIKYNIILLINHKNLIRVHDSINSEVDKEKEQLDKNKYDKNAIAVNVTIIASQIFKKIFYFLKVYNFGRNTEVK